MENEGTPAKEMGSGLVRQGTDPEFVSLEMQNNDPIENDH